MLLLTDLTDRELDPLELPRSGSNVKPGLTTEDLHLCHWLDRALGSAGPLRPRKLAGPPDARWAALVVVGQADGSQYDALQAATRLGPPPAPVAAVALVGRGFHGNRGRPWRTERGNLHLSCAVPLDLDAARDARGVPALAAVAVCDALAVCAPGLRPRIKWINDVLLDEAKVAGVLSAVQSQGTRLRAATLGIGLNVAVAPPVPPTVFVPRVTCLQEHPAADGVTLGRALGAVLGALAARLEQLDAAGADPLVAAYRALCGDLGRDVAVWPEGSPDAARWDDLPPPLAAGRVVGLDDDLALRLAGVADPLHGGRLAYPHRRPGGGTGV